MASGSSQQRMMAVTTETTAVAILIIMTMAKGMEADRWQTWVRPQRRMKLKKREVTSHPR